MKRPIFIRKKILIILFIIVCVGMTLWVEEVQYYSKKILWTEYSLRNVRLNINEFRKLNNRIPQSLAEIVQYAKEHPDSGFKKHAFGEYLSDTDGNRKEYHILNGQGGLFYNKETGEVKANLTKPVKHYLRFYFGEKRNEIPADW